MLECVPQLMEADTEQACREMLACRNRSGSVVGSARRLIPEWHDVSHVRSAQAALSRSSRQNASE
jgi:hypothetical protein